MPQHQELIHLEKGVWKLLTDTDVTALNFQIMAGTAQIRRGDTTSPVDDAKGWRYITGAGERLASLDTLSGAPGNRVWGTALYLEGATVLVDHA